MPAGSELLVRYVTSRRHYRPIDSTVKPEAFTPDPYTELSVTKKNELTDDQLWAIGQDIVQESGPPKSLHGRSEFDLTAVRDFVLPIKPDPTPKNPHHMVIYGWPVGKPAQKIHALKIAEVASKLIRPPTYNAPSNPILQPQPQP
jgi:hypothetical protein